MTIESEGTVTVELRDAAGDRVDEVHSHYTGNGGKAPYNHRAEQEITQLDVRSDEESWSISDEPLENADSWNDPDEPLEGSGPDVVLIDWEPTDVEVEMEHSGESNFAIWAHNIDEVGFSDLLVNEIGEYTGSETMSEDTAFLHVEADGDWTITPS
ncbi:hypothetical protein [Nocardiopsis salina]|uniref:hypothetical protein n=1 Tax=Nocardiopsis salina TaxID=245836 RepID=UPI00034981AA|nr:hypothetical protein [Nocardiopsis salina]